MKKCVVGMACALAVAFMAAPRTQAQTESKTKIKTEKGNLVTYTGCVETGGETRSYVLDHVVPIGRTMTETKGTSGTVVSTTTTYALVPGEKVELQQHVGHKVEVTGVMVPAGKGDTKIETRTKSKQGTEETKTEVERGAYPQLRVISVKHLAESCS
jgi:hypothetical protein